MKKRFFCTPLAVLVLISSTMLTHVRAQSALFPETVIVATRIEQPITDVISDVTILDRSVIERSGASGIADVLSRIPGVSFSRNGGVGSTTSIYVRGAESRFTPVYIDGIRIDSQSTGGASWNALPLSQIDRIELLRGPAAAIYGSDALGGVIQIFTRKGEGGFSPEIEIGAGSYGTHKTNISVAGLKGAVDYAIGLSRESSNGFNAQLAANPDKDGYKSVSSSARLGFKLDESNRLEASFLDSSMNAQYDAVTRGRDDHSLLDLQAAGLNWMAKWSDVYKTRLSFNQGKDRYKTTPSIYQTDTSVTSYLWLNEWKIGQSNLTASLERREDKLNNASTTPRVSERSQNAIAIGYALRSGSHAFQLNARHDDDSEFGGYTTGAASYAYSFMQNWRATLAAGNAFRAPTLFQRFSIYGLPSLKPETGNNVEVGLKFKQQGNELRVSLYQNNVRNLINCVNGNTFCTSTVGQYANTGIARYSGLSVSGLTSALGVDWGGSLDLQDPENLSTGKKLSRRPKQLMTLTAETRIFEWAVGIELLGVGERFDNATNTARLPGYGLLNVTANKKLSPDWTLISRFDNVGDKVYQTTLGYAMLGRSLYLGLKWAPGSFAK